MAIITFMSDFGQRDHYVAAVKAKIFSINPNVNIVDITHHIEHFNIAHAAFVLKSVFKDFPKGTVHLVSVNSPSLDKDKMVAVKLDDHYFVGVDNGLFSLLSDNYQVPIIVVELNKESQSSIFPEKTVLATAAASLASGTAIYSLGKQLLNIKQMLNRQLRITKHQISGHVIHVDNYGNLITNISFEVFEKAKEDRKYTFSFAREIIDTLSTSYDSTDSGDCIVLFNSNGYLEIAICQGNASELLGLSYDSPVNIFFVAE